MRVHRGGVCVWDASDNGIGEAGAVALAEAVTSGQCQLTSLDVSGESLVPCRQLGRVCAGPAGCVRGAGAVCSERRISLLFIAIIIIAATAHHSTDSVFN